MIAFSFPYICFLGGITFYYSKHKKQKSLHGSSLRIVFIEFLRMLMDQPWTRKLQYSQD